jgi:hypothetical protein
MSKALMIRMMHHETNSRTFLFFSVDLAPKDVVDLGIQRTNDDEMSSVRS